MIEQEDSQEEDDQMTESEKIAAAMGFGFDPGNPET